MELVLNELSLTGQYPTVENFIEKGISPLLKLFAELGNNDEVYKKYDFYNCFVTENKNVHGVLTGVDSRKYDELRRFKIYLTKLFENPYWEDNPKHSLNLIYKCNEKNVTNTSVAESSERDKMLISFNHNEFQEAELEVQIEGENHVLKIYNLTAEGRYLEACWVQGKISIEDYCKQKYNGKSKLNFDFIDSRQGFNLLQSKEDIDLFEEGFKKFDELTWQEISVDDGLDYKPYENKNFYKEVKVKKHKFRISQKYRCFGFVENGLFNVLCFDLTHKLSD